MRSGYSILLGEHVDAGEIDYHDCKAFQIVCPACREPVFKAVRSPEGSPAQHFLNHYPTAQSTAEQCELRVRSADPAQRTAADTASRGQRLAHFLGVMPSVLGRLPLYEGSWQKAHYHASKSPAMSFFYDAQAESLEHAGHAAFFAAAADTYMQRLDEANVDLPTSFSRRRQQMIAADMWATICTSPGRRNFRWLFIHAWLIELNSWAVRPAGESPADRAVALSMYDYMTSALCMRSKSDIAPLFSRMRRERLPAGYNTLPFSSTDENERSSYFTRVCGNVAAQMAGALLGMPYWELLRTQFGNQTLEYPAPVSPVDHMQELESLDGRQLVG